MAEKEKITMPKLGEKKKAAAPTKQTMNFAHHKSNVDPKRLIPVVAVIIILAAALLKFGIIDQNNKRLAVYNDLGRKQNQLAEINAKLGDYDELEKEYGRYSYGWMTDGEKELVDRMEVLDLLKKHVSPAALIENFSISENVLTMNLRGVTLEDASGIVKALESSDIVESATVYSASAAEAKEASIFMSVVLTKAVAE